MAKTDVSGAVNYTLPGTMTASTYWADYSMHGYYCTAGRQGCDLWSSMEQVNVSTGHWSISIHRPAGVGWGSPRLLQLSPCRSVACLLSFHQPTVIRQIWNAIDHSCNLYYVMLIFCRWKSLVYSCNMLWKKNQQCISCVNTKKNMRWHAIILLKSISGTLLKIEPTSYKLVWIEWHPYW